MDAAVIFSDILVPCAAMGQAVSFQDGVGPSLAPVVRSRADVDRLHDFDAKHATGFVGDAIRRVRAELGETKAILGFCGAPWTTASYMIEGGSSRNFEASKRMLYADPKAFERLCARLVENLVPYLAMQVEAGADVLQIFDSWGGALDAQTYRQALLPHVTRLVAGAKATGVPVILYVNGCAQMLEVLAEAQPDVIGLDWRVTPSDAIARVGARVALQGNLDPCVLFAPPDVIEREVQRTLSEFAHQKGYVFNLGSGILPGTPVESMETLFRVLRDPTGNGVARDHASAHDHPDLLGPAERERLRQQITSTDYGGRLPAQTVDSILDQINAIRARRLVRHPFRVGQKVRVKEGPFTGESGQVASIDVQKGTLHVTLVLSGHGHQFELDWWQLEIE
jgi:uroporphyrinogen decarboxylase